MSPTEVTGVSVFEYDISSAGADAAALAILQNMQCRTVRPVHGPKKLAERQPSGLGAQLPSVLSQAVEGGAFLRRGDDRGLGPAVRQGWHCGLRAGCSRIPC